MTRVLGDAFDAYTAYNPTGLAPSDVPQERKDELLHSIRISVYQLIGLAAGTMILSTAMISLWICIGERVAKRVRAQVYTAIAVRKMEWFDLGMGLVEDGQPQNDGQDQDGSSLGAGGLMAKFGR